MMRLVVIVGLLASGVAAQPLTFSDDLRPILAGACFGCHGKREHEGGIDLESAASAQDLRGDPETWSRALARVDGGFMPPASAPALHDQDRADLVRGLRHLLAGEGKPRAGTPTLRRLGRFEYARTIRALLGTPVDARRALPPDAKGYGFDNMGDTMFVSPLLMERYAEVTEQLLDEVFSDEKRRAALLGADSPPDDPDERAAVLRRFMSRAFRRPASDEEVAGRSELVETARRGGDDTTEAMRAGVKSVLLSPNFIFRVESRPDGHPAGEDWPLDDWALATRLSYFLWSTMPDARLFALARDGKLREESALVAEVTRMLDDPQSRALADRFAAQWLGFDAIKTKSVEVWRFKKNRFHQLRGVMYEEAARAFDDLVRRDRPATLLLDSDETWLNAGLAKHYGIAGVKGQQMQLAKLPDRRRGGVLGMGAILSTTSSDLRTSPTVRGKWVLETLLGTPPPPPPPNAGALPADDKPGKDGLTLRAQLEQHRKDKKCAACHAQIDPLGIALENFDPTGQWRDKLHGAPVESSTVLANGRKIAGPEELRGWLVTQKDRFTRNLIERLLTYAIGRPLALYDAPVVDSIHARAVASGYRMRVLIEGVVLSYPFLHRGGP
ncbi:MAG: hypothetical protein CMJ83_07840 [Planctomycetes bacterium]|nr:hypothetical protein [Planctomycetota bacterium]